MSNGVWWKSVITLIIAVILFGCVVAIATNANAQKFMKPDNSIAYFCKDKYNYNGINNTSSRNMMLFAACISEMKNDVRRQKNAEQWEFIKANPEYRFPGQSLNKCFAKPRESIVKRVEKNKDGVVVYYKDTTNPCLRN